MATLGLAILGSAAGQYAAVSLGATAGGFLALTAAGVGGALGATAGGYIDNSLFGNTQRLPNVVGQRLADTGIQVSTYGGMIPIVYGRTRLAGNVIWSAGIREEEIRTEQSSGGKGIPSGGGGQTAITYKYYCTLAIAICEGEINEITRAWADSKPLSEDILSASDDKYNIYLGSETQIPDPIIESYEGSGNVPAYRGISYVVIKDFPLADFGNRIPNFTFEVVKNVQKSPTVEELVKDIVIIPGSGEYVYDTSIVTKTSGEQVLNEFGLLFVENGITEQVNMHNFDNVADVRKSVDDMLKTFPNLERVSLVVTWYSTSKFLADSDIIPKAEVTGQSTKFSSTWGVNGLTRDTAQLVKRLPNGNMNFGGTPDDRSVINLIVYLKSKGIEVMFYPFLAIDTLGTEGGGEDAKPWRGRMTPTGTSELNNWFTKTNGYNEYIEYYANLEVGGVYLKDNIDKFVIGSEMRGITQFMPTAGVFPGVDNFISLAATIKAIVGPSVEVGYAADWSEYHSTEGWFNMDPLYMDSNIDFIGIDYYMPLTPDLPQKQITKELIKQYITSGEGWNYFFTDSEARTGQTDYTPNDGTSIYAWKNMEAWWKASTHVNPDSSNVWSPKPKKLILTEYGFPSVDACSNQPNVFVDPTSIESFYPRASKRQVDFQAQRESITSMLEHFQEKNAEVGNSNFVPEMYLWTWDARPYPLFPDLKEVWTDADNWKTGHWVTGKLGGSNLGAIVADLLGKVGLTSDDYNVDSLEDYVEGYINTRLMTVRDWLQQLQSVFFFDMVESDGVLKFVKRARPIVKTIPSEDIISVKNNNIEILVNIDRKQELELPKEVNVTFLDRNKDYQNNTQISQRQTVEAVDKEIINVPLVLSVQKGKNVADIRLYNQWAARNTYQFSLSNEHIELEPTDIINVVVNGITHTIRLVSVNLSKTGNLICEGFSEDISSYDFYNPGSESLVKQTEGNVIPSTNMVLLDLPLMPGETDGTKGTLRVALSSPNIPKWKGATIYRSDDGGETGGNTWGIVGSSQFSSVLGTTISVLSPGITDIFDTENYVDVLIKSGESQIVSATEISVLNGANACVIGDEILQFQTATILDSDTKKVRLSNLLRGRLGTEFAAGISKAIGSSFVLLTTANIKITMPFSLIGVERHYKAVTAGSSLSQTSEQTFTYNAVSYLPYSVVDLQGVLNGSDWDITWVRRTRTGGELLNNIGTVPLNEQSELYEIDIMDGVNVVNTYTSTTPDFTYTSAQQTTDFGAPQSSIEVNIYQMSAVIGRGRVANAIFS